MLNDYILAALLAVRKASRNVYRTNLIIIYLLCVDPTLAKNATRPRSGGGGPNSTPATPPSTPAGPPAAPHYPYLPQMPYLPPSAPPLPPSPPPLFCPHLPPYPGVSSIQILDCDIEFPEPDTCGLSIFNGAQLQLRPGQALAVQYRNLNSTTAQLSRLVISAERMSFTLLVAGEPRPHRLLVVSGLCQDANVLTTCLHDAYHGVPQYRACQRCFGINMVSELAGGGDWDGGGDGAAFVPLAGDTSTVGDTSYFRSQLLSGTALVSSDGSSGSDGTDAVLYFLASMSSDVVQLSYSRAARVLYLPSARVTYLPASNRSFDGITSGGGDHPSPPPGFPGGSSSSSSSPPPISSNPGSSNSSSGNVEGPGRKDPNADGDHGPGGTAPPVRVTNETADMSVDRQSARGGTRSDGGISNSTGSTSSGDTNVAPSPTRPPVPSGPPPNSTTGSATPTRGLPPVRGNVLVAVAVAAAAWLVLGI